MKCVSGSSKLTQGKDPEFLIRELDYHVPSLEVSFETDDTSFFFFVGFCLGSANPIFAFLEDQPLVDLVAGRRMSLGTWHWLKCSSHYT